MDLNAKIFVAGHNGLVGSAILKTLNREGYLNIVVRNRADLNLMDYNAVADFFEKEQPEFVFLAAAKVGGILDNNIRRGAFIYENLMIQNHVIHLSHIHKVKKLLFLGSTCIYPKDCQQPIKEEYLLTGPLEYTNEPYAIAKIAGIKLCESYNIQYDTNFLSVMPTNLYGPNDNFDLERSHVLPALIRKIHLAKLYQESNFNGLIADLRIPDIDEIHSVLSNYGITKTSVEIWGSGKPMREFLWSEDMAAACVFVMKEVNFKACVSNSKDIRNTHINIGTGEDISIENMAQLIKSVIGYKGNFTFNLSKPDGTFRKLTDCSKINTLGWKHTVNLQDGVKRLYDWYLQNK
ncbi:GDP-L-fucose synthase family protein [Mariniflexile sp. AS56]|uniref:GDP-L-fucose synthase family protein n=1 Tax=Mariniflexile sp. AS56 TaxID=3063957 RepID=UPI0026EF2BD2|nr:GDP-L-fucose synthase [Mariniflexile sp. AS56]MDO7172720.1 GDP-L-fucose synthase [Mariniflexile sp. AS56]